MLLALIRGAGGREDRGHIPGGGNSLPGGKHQETRKDPQPPGLKLAWPKGEQKEGDPD